VKRFQQNVSVIRSHRLIRAFLGNRGVVRGSISAAMVLSLILCAVMCFLWMVDPEPASHDWLSIGKGHFSDSHVSANSGHFRERFSSPAGD